MRGKEEEMESERTDFIFPASWSGTELFSPINAKKFCPLGAEGGICLPA